MSDWQLTHGSVACLVDLPLRLDLKTTDVFFQKQFNIHDLDTEACRGILESVKVSVPQLHARPVSSYRTVVHESRNWRSAYV